MSINLQGNILNIFTYNGGYALMLKELSRLILAYMQ